VGKSTTAVSLGAALADLGYRVLVVDLDPQGNASTGLGVRHEARAISVYDVIVWESPAPDAIVPTSVEGLHALPSTIDLAGAEIELVSQFSRESRLRRALEPLAEGKYDFVFLDCPPSLGLLTINALAAAQELIVPIQCEYYALEGLGQLLRNVGLVQQNINPGLRLSGIVMTMFDPRTKLSEQVVAEVRRYFEEIVYDVIIPRTVRLSEAPGFGVPITEYDPKSKGAQSYRELAVEVALREPPAEPVPIADRLPSPETELLWETGPASPPSPPAESELEEAEIPRVSEVAGEPQLAEPGGEEPGEAPAAALEHAAAPEAAVESGPGADQTPAAEPEEPEPEEPEPEEPEPSPQETEPARAAAPDVAQVPEDLWKEEEPEPRIRGAVAPVPPGEHPVSRVVVVGESGGRPGERRSDDAGEEAAASDRIGSTLEDAKPGRKRRWWQLFRRGGG
jgi:chromosome partitioning protein